MLYNKPVSERVIMAGKAAWKGCESFFKKDKGNIFKAMSVVHDEFEQAMEGDKQVKENKEVCEESSGN